MTAIPHYTPPVPSPLHDLQERITATANRLGTRAGADALTELQENLQGVPTDWYGTRRSIMHSWIRKYGGRISDV